MLRGVQHNMFSRTSLDKLLNKIDCSSALKDGMIEAVHDLLDTDTHTPDRLLCLTTKVVSDVFRDSDRVIGSRCFKSTHPVVPEYCGPVFCCDRLTTKIKSNNKL